MSHDAALPLGTKRKLTRLCRCTVGACEQPAKVSYCTLHRSAIHGGYLLLVGFGTVVGFAVGVAFTVFQ